MGISTDKETSTANADLFSGFSKLNLNERLQRLMKMGALSPEDVKSLKYPEMLDINLAEHFIENVIGYFQMPMGIAANFVIDGKSFAIPMAVEETSIIAAASKTAKWIRENGSISTECIGKNIIGQIQIAKVRDYDRLARVLHSSNQQLIDTLNDGVAKGLVLRGGGVEKIELRKVPRPDGKSMAVIHVMANACDAMGANIMNQICEDLRPKIEELSGESVTMCILSNLVDTKLTRAKVVMKGLDPQLMKKIEEASLFAEQDPYRAATNNKGVLNGIDPILIATGNDWRAVEAGIHAYAARNGQYSSITRWKVKNDELIGIFEAPLIVGIVGGMTKLHPMAKMSLRMMGIETAEQLSRICAAVGLVQNLGALRALTTVGIIEGHMKLHIKNLSLGAGAKEAEMPYVQKRLEEILTLTKKITLSNAVEVLKELRSRDTQSEISR